MQLKILRPQFDGLQSWLGMIGHFLSLFDTLTTLEIKDIIHSREQVAEGELPLPNALLQGILIHEGLTTLAISHSEFQPRRQVPWLLPSTAKIIIDGLPYLKGFEFPLGKDVVSTH